MHLITQFWHIFPNLLFWIPTIFWDRKHLTLSRISFLSKSCSPILPNLPSENQTRMEVEREITLHHHDCPLRIKSQLAQRDGISCIFQIRHRTIPSRDGRRLPPPPSIHPRFPPQQTRSRSSGPHENNRTGRSLIPYLIEVKSEKDQEPCENGIAAPLNDLFDRIHVGPIKLGTIEKMVGPPPNILVDRVSFWHVCRFMISWKWVSSALNRWIITIQ